jgi:hypothetical protein
MITDKQRAAAKPILFMSELVAAIRDGRKTVTRRLKLQHQPGDILYATETHWVFGHWEQDCKNGKGRDSTNRLGWRFVCDDPLDIRFNPVEGALISRDKTKPTVSNWYKRNARFMPRAYARTFILIKDVRIEYLRDITEADALLEGVYRGKASGRFALSYMAMCLGDWRASGRGVFQEIWSRLHTEAGTTWDDNPAVVRLQFERVENDNQN